MNNFIYGNITNHVHDCHFCYTLHAMMIITSLGTLQRNSPYDLSSILYTYTLILFASYGKSLQVTNTVILRPERYCHNDYNARSLPQEPCLISQKMHSDQSINIRQLLLRHPEHAYNIYEVEGSSVGHR